MKKHFVSFYSPGTFAAEQTTQEIDGWDTNKAMEMARSIKERYGATPYGFEFTTRERKDNDFDSIEIARSQMYFLGGKIKTLTALMSENNPDNKILIDNMKINGWDCVIENTNSYKWTQPLGKNDVVLPFVKK